MGSPLRSVSKLEPSLLPLIRVIGYTKMLLYAILYEKTFFQYLQVLNSRGSETDPSEPPEANDSEDSNVN